MYSAAVALAGFRKNGAPEADMSKTMKVTALKLDQTRRNLKANDGSTRQTDFRPNPAVSSASWLNTGTIGGRYPKYEGSYAEANGPLKKFESVVIEGSKASDIGFNFLNPNI
jgi:hypothetical protein